MAVPLCDLARTPLTTVSNFLSAVLIAMRRQTHARTQCNALSAGIALAVCVFGAYGQEVGRSVEDWDAT